MAKRKVSNRMRDSGDFDEDTKQIRINPKRGDLINTVIHEDLHDKQPKLTEKEVSKKAKRLERKLSIRKAIDLLKRFI